MSSDKSQQKTIDRLLRREQLLAEFARTALRPGIKVEALLTDACNFAQEGLGVRYVKALKYRPDQGDLLIVAGFGWKPGVVGHATLPLGMRSPPGRALQTGQPVLVTDLARSTEFDYSPLLRDHGVASLINVPIVADAETWGVFEVDSNQPSFVNEHDAQFLYVFARILGEAIQRCEIDEQREQSLSALANAAEQRTLLLRELQHRFRNSLTMIQSILAFRAKAAAPDVQAEIQNIYERVAAIALAQDQLVLSEHLRAVDVSAYLGALCAQLQHSRPGMVVEAVVDKLILSVEQAIPIGLIANEAVTNALKHAFKEGSGTVRVSLKMTEARAKLTIEDNGVGRSGSHQGQGLRLIDRLAVQIGGRFDIADRPGGDGADRRLHGAITESLAARPCAGAQLH